MHFITHGHVVSACHHWHESSARTPRKSVSLAACVMLQQHMPSSFLTMHTVTWFLPCLLFLLQTWPHSKRSCLKAVKAPLFCRARDRLHVHTHTPIFSCPNQAPARHLPCVHYHAMTIQSCIHSSRSQSPCTRSPPPVPSSSTTHALCAAPSFQRTRTHLLDLQTLTLLAPHPASQAHNNRQPTHLHRPPLRSHKGTRPPLHLTNQAQHHMPTVIQLLTCTLSTRQAATSLMQAASEMHWTCLSISRHWLLHRAPTLQQLVHHFP